LWSSENKNIMNKIGKNVVIAESAVFGENISIGNNVVIHENVVIKDHVYIWDNAVIGRNPMGVRTVKSKVEVRSEKTVIGSNTVIGCGVVLYAGTFLGERCLLGDNVVIRENNVLDNDVIIGPLSFIQKNCRIGAGTRMVQMSSLASGTMIGKNNFLSSSFCSVSDKTFGEFGYSDKMVGPKIGDNNLIGPDATIMDNIEIGNNNLIGAKALITKSIGDNSVYLGIPGKFIRKRYPDDQIP